MPVTVSQVLASKPDSLSTAANQVGVGANEVDQRIASERSRLGELAAKWTGTAADAAQGHAGEMLADQRQYRDTLTAVQRELASAGEELSRLRADLANLVSSVEAKLFDIADDGATSPGTLLRTLARLSPVLAMDVTLRGLALQTAIQTALDKFDAADLAAAYRLRQVNRGVG